MIRKCIHCQQSFIVDEKIDARLRELGPDHFHKVCAVCAIAAIEKIAEEDIWTMPIEEIEAELREDGVDVKAFKARIAAIAAMAKELPE